MRNNRLDEMEQVIAKSGTISMVQLCDLFQVSMNTVRRDVAELKRRGCVRKVYGGVSATKEENPSLRPFEERNTISESAKRAICRRAAKLVEDGDVIFADSGTTVMHLAEELSERRNVTIITNNLALVGFSLPFDNLNVIVLPGQLQRRTYSVTGGDTIRALGHYNINKAFLAATGTTRDGVTNSSPFEYEIKHTVIERTPACYLLLCRDKFGHGGLMTYAEFSDLKGIVTDGLPGREYMDEIEKAGVTLYVAEEGPD